MQHRSSWVPSHGKHPEWSPPAGASEKQWRQLNDVADAEATDAKMKYAAGAAAEAKPRTDAAAWSAAALATAARASQLLLNRYELNSVAGMAPRASKRSAQVVEAPTGSPWE